MIDYFRGALTGLWDKLMTPFTLSLESIMAILVGAGIILGVIYLTNKLLFQIKLAPGLIGWAIRIVIGIIIVLAIAYVFKGLDVSTAPVANGEITDAIVNMIQ